MGLHNSIYALASLSVGLITLFIAAVAWPRRSTPGTTPFIGLMLAVTWWVFMSALEYASADIALKLLFAKLSYIGITAVAPLWFIFAARYTGYDEGLSGRRILFLWCIPALTLALVVTNESFALIWPSITLSGTPPNEMLVYDHGYGFWAHAVYSYTLLALGTLILVRAAVHSPSVYRRQAIMLALSAAAPWVANVIYLSGNSPLPGLDLTPFGFAITGMMITWSMVRHQLLNIVPVAQDALFGSMTDGVMVVDKSNRIIEMNTAARHLLGTTASARGQSANEVLADYPDLAASLQELTTAQVRVTGKWQRVPRWLDVRVSVLYDQRRNEAGRLIVLQDITARKEVELALRGSEASYRGLFNAVPDAIYIQDREGRFIDVNQAAVTMYGYPREYFIGKTPEMVAAPGKNDQNIFTAAHALALEGLQQEFEFWGRRLSGEVFLERVRLNKGSYFGRDVVIALAHDITHAHQFEQDNDRLLMEAQHRARHLALVNDIAAVINSSLDLQTIFQSVADGLARALAVPQTGVALFNELHTHLTIVAEHVGPQSTPAVGTELPTAHNGSLEQILTTKAPLYIADAQHDPLLESMWAVMAQRRVVSLLLVPLVIDNDVIGTIGCDSIGEPHSFSAEEVGLATTLANLSAVRIQQARRYARMQAKLMETAQQMVQSTNGSHRRPADDDTDEAPFAIDLLALDPSHRGLRLRES